MRQELETRLGALRDELPRRNLDGILVQERTNSLYFSGFSCSNSFLLLTRKHGIFLTDFRYQQSAAKAIGHLEVHIIPQRGVVEIAAFCKKLKIRKLGFEQGTYYNSVETLKQALGPGVDLVPAGDVISGLRQLKSPYEIRKITASQRLNEQIYTETMEKVQLGDTERSIRNRILHRMIDLECEEAFSSIIAAGKNSALPHAVPTSKKVEKNQLLLFDMGVKQNFYHSDMTRTVGVGEKLGAKAAKIYDVVLKAQLKALSMLGPGVACKDVDAAAREVISEAGYRDFFGHGLGHGVGLEIHEGPTLNPRSTDVLKAGMVVTIEPGIYVPDTGGVRIEDLVAITETGYKNLTRVPKDLSFISG